MRLENQKKSKNFLDLSWVLPYLSDFMYPAAEMHGEIPAGYHRSYINDPTGDMTEDEIHMARSGASYKDLMFRRAMRKQNREGFSPYFNPNEDYSKRK